VDNQVNNNNKDNANNITTNGMGILHKQEQAKKD
jgi:hypothetical protein